MRERKDSGLGEDEMDKRIIRIRTKAGNMIERKGTITDFADGTSLAVVGNHRYIVIDRDFYGPIWGTRK